MYIAALLLALTGNWVDIPRPGCGHLVATFVSLATQAGALGSVFLFFFITGCPESRLPGARVLCVGRVPNLLGCLMCPCLSMKRQMCNLKNTPDRTNNRIRSPRLTASG